MSYRTSLKVKGKREEIIAIVNIMKEYLDEKLSIYFDDILISKEKKKGYCTIYDMSKEDINGTIDVDGVYFFEADGPCGRFLLLDDTDFFKEIAEASPKTNFEGLMQGTDNMGCDTYYKAELKKGLLKLTMKYPNDEEYDDEDYDDEDYKEDEEPSYTKIYNPVSKKYEELKYETIGELVELVNEGTLGFDEGLDTFVKEFMKTVPYKDFLNYFSINDEEFTEDDYEELVYNSDFMNDYSGFQEFCPDCEISEKDYNKVLEEISKLKIKK